MTSKLHKISLDEAGAEPPYLQQDDGDDGHLGTQPGEETLQLPALTNQIAVDDDGDQAHGLHGSLQRERESERGWWGAICVVPRVPQAFSRTCP